MDEVLVDDVVGDLGFSLLVENDLWLEHDDRLDVEFGLDQEQVSPPQPVDPSAVFPCATRPSGVYIDGVPCPENLHVDNV